MSSAQPIAHGSGQMGAQSISIQVSTRERCNAGCRFCISRTTPGVETPGNPHEVKFCDEPRLQVGLNYARQLGATHAILTSRADPSQEDPRYLHRLISTSRQFLPLVDMHTNGFLWLPGKPQADDLSILVVSGLTMLTLSIASFDQNQNRELMMIRESGAGLIRRARDLGLLVRCSLVVNSQGVNDYQGVINYIKQAGNLGAHMVVVREVWRPEVYGDFQPEVLDWNNCNWVDIGPIQSQFIQAAGQRDNPYGLQLRDPLPWGTPVMVMGGVFDDPNHGVNITFARCEEGTRGSTIKSIVHKPDGHGYRNWDHNGDILY